MRHLNRRHQIGRTERKEQYKMRKQIKPKEIFKNLYYDDSIESSKYS